METTRTRARFDAKVDRNGPVQPHMDTACWEWTGAKNKRCGYGMFWLNGKRVRAHRMAWEVTHGEIRDGLWVLHKCDNRICVRLEHLFLGTNIDNVEDRQAKGRNRVMRGNRNGARSRPDRLARGERNGRAKLTEDDVREIRRGRAGGESYSVVALRFGVSKQTISEIVSREIWKHVA